MRDHPSDTGYGPRLGRRLVHRPPNGLAAVANGKRSQSFMSIVIAIMTRDEPWVSPRPPIRSIFFHWSETWTILPSILDILAFFYNTLMLRFWISKLNQKLSIKSDTYWWMWPRRCEQRSGWSLFTKVPGTMMDVDILTDWCIGQILGPHNRLTGYLSPGLFNGLHAYNFLFAW